VIFRNLALRLRMLFGYVPNAEWLRVILNREVLFDRARAQAAIAEMERCLTLQRRGDLCARLRNLA
jgi:hypothetical protein